MSLEALVPQIEQWLKDRGAEFIVRQPCGTLWPAEPEPAYEYTPPERPIKGRHLFIAEDPTPEVFGYTKHSLAVRPDELERGLEWLTQGASAILVRGLWHIPNTEPYPWESPHPEYIRIRVAVVL